MASANNAKKGANVRMKRKERKNIAAGQAHIPVSYTHLRGLLISFDFLSFDCKCYQLKQEGGTCFSSLSVAGACPTT